MILHNLPNVTTDRQILEDKKSDSSAEGLLQVGIGFFFLLVEALGGGVIH